MLHKVRVSAKAEWMGQDYNDLLAALLRKEVTDTIAALRQEDK